MNAEISRKVAYLAKRKTLSLVEGSVEEQFGKIRNYCAELKQTDRDSTIILKLTEDEVRPMFQRMYVYFSACKLGFQDTCRPVIGVDGCFLKSKTGGQLFLILDAREKSIIEMFEAIKNLLMRRFQLNREKVEKWNIRNCPRIRAILVKISLEVAKLIPMKSDDMHFQIKATSSQEQHTVDLSTNSYSYRQWDLTDTEAFVSHYYKTEAYKKCYSRSIMPINGPDLWLDFVFPPPLPPVKRPNRIEIQIGGSSNTLSNVNVDQSTIIQTPVYVKGGRNYTTISRLRSISSDSRRQVQSMSQPVLKTRSGTNISKKRITSSQSSVIKK
ncbi:uncharacterized protein LOC122055169 [Zingiber officinale]|uniref:uncharacterized protein LOC122055169 n=1 Tax=Zingiber officinale TaxID=94328 RepID=UPI001C4BDD33|nr:uncharacterized protein LOC122055169 [Zingiber officinale]